MGKIDLGAGSLEKVVTAATITGDRIMIFRADSIRA
jgi:hypothetical protein